MQPTVYQVVVGGAMLANAIIGHFLYRAAFSEAGHQPILAATALAVGVAGIAVQIVAKPISWALDLARDVGASGASIARGAFQFWLIVLGVSFGAQMLENFLPKPWL